MAVACLFIACKYEEIYPPAFSHFVEICGKAYTMEDIVKTEGIILEFSKFHLGDPTSYTHLERLILIFHVPIEDVNTVKCLVELALLDIVFYEFSPMTIAAASILFIKGHVMNTKFNLESLNLN